MRKLEGIEACRNCVSRDYVTNKGLVCKLTGNAPTLDEACENFVLDEELTKVAPLPEQEVAEEVNREDLLAEENMPFGIAAGLVACVVGAVLWALISVSTGRQIGYMAIGMGFIVGYAMRIFGKGVRPIFGVVGALLALLGCVMGDFFSIIGFVSQDTKLSLFASLSSIDYGQAFSYLLKNLASMTILFYGIALFEGYKLSFRLQIQNGGKI